LCNLVGYSIIEKKEYDIKMGLCKKAQIQKWGMNMADDRLFQDSDLTDLFAEFNAANAGVEEEPDPEMEASQRRYQEIINRHKGQGK